MSSKSNPQGQRDPGTDSVTGEDEVTTNKYPRRTQRKVETRRKIMRAAFELVNAEGSDKLTMAAVAERADIHVTTLFTHFSSRQELLVAFSEPAIANLRKIVREARGEIPFFTFLARIQREYAEYLEAGGQERAETGLFLRNQVELLPAWLRYERCQIEQYSEYIREDFDLSPLRSRLIAGMIVSVNIFTYEAWMEDPLNFDLVKAVEGNVREVEQVMRGGMLATLATE